MKRYLLACVLSLVLVSCGQAPFSPPSATVVSAPAASGPPSNIEYVNRGIATAGQTLTELYNAARVYADLPRCGATAARICSDRNVVREIRRYAIQAHNAYVAARANEASVELVARMWGAIGEFKKSLALAS